MRLTLYGDNLTLNGVPLALYTGAVVAPPRGDDAFRSAGSLDRFWRERAEEELEDLLDRAKEAVRRPVEARRVIAEEFRLIEWEALPQARQIGELLQVLTAPQPDYTVLAALILAEMQRLRIKARRKRDIEAVMLLS